MLAFVWVHAIPVPSVFLRHLQSLLMNFLISLELLNLNNNNDNNKNSLKNPQYVQRYFYYPGNVFVFSNLYIFQFICSCVSQVCHLSDGYLFTFWLGNNMIKFHVKNRIHNWTECRSCHLFLSFINTFIGGIQSLFQCLMAVIMWPTHAVCISS